MAANLGMETVGEGIEEPSQLEMLRSLRCRYAQGYLIARPMSSNRLDEVFTIAAEQPGESTTPEEPDLEERTPVRYTSSGAHARRTVPCAHRSCRK